jgi:hypothetical protein
MMGGVDGYTTWRPQSQPGLTWALVVQRAAEGAASTATSRHFGGETIALLGAITADEVPTDPVFEATLDGLWWQLMAVRPDAAERASLAALWTEVASEEGPESAWTAVLTALFRDGAFVGY